MSEILLYDIPRKDPENGPWSPNTLKARLALKFKGLPFKTVWVEYPDIASECKKIGAPPTRCTPDGSPMYTLPAIYDPSTKMAVADSYAIAEYLDATYPTDRQLIPSGTEGLQAAFYTAFNDIGFYTLMFAVGTYYASIMNPPSEQYLRSLRKELLARIESLDREEQLQKAKSAFDTIDGWYKKAGQGKVFLMGDSSSWADVAVAALFLSVRNIGGRDTKEWQIVSRWHGGRWGKLAAALDQ